MVSLEPPPTCIYPSLGPLKSVFDPRLKIDERCQNHCGVDVEGNELDADIDPPLGPLGPSTYVRTIFPTGRLLARLLHQFLVALVTYLAGDAGRLRDIGGRQENHVDPSRPRLLALSSDRLGYTEPIARRRKPLGRQRQNLKHTYQDECVVLPDFPLRTPLST